MKNTNKQTTLFISFTGLIFFIWWLGIAGSDFYWLPAIIWIIATSYWIIKGQFAGILETSTKAVFDWSTGKGNRIVWVFLFANCLLWIIYILLKYYSFNYHTFDTGIYHNIVYNLSHGEFFSSFHNVNFLANHFNINLVLISPLYKITPYPHWLVLLKVIAFLACAWFIWKLCRENLPEKDYMKWALVLLVLWLFLYKPIINSVRYEFQGSCLSLPFIFYAFLCLQRENWVRFWVTMLLLLGFKEHLASVWIGFGCYLLLSTPRKKLGLLLILLGIAALYVIMEQIMPWARDYKETWRPDVVPWKDLDLKIRYGLALLLPFAFLPLVFWRHGIMAGPPIGINLISSYDNMYSSHYHYDDVASCLLFIATILAIRDLPLKRLWERYIRNRWLQTVLVVAFLFLLILLPKSNLRFIRESIPEQKHFAILEEIRRLDQSVSPKKRFAIMDIFGIYFNRRQIQVFTSHAGENCLKENRTSVMETIGEIPEIDYIVLARGLGFYNLSNFDTCIRDLEESRQYLKLDGYEHLLVFRRSTN